jgi:hypothetical protein
MQRIPFTYDGQEFDFEWELVVGDLIKITCYHDIYKSTFGSFIKKFSFFGYMIEEGKKTNPEFFEAMNASMLAHEKAKRR